MSPFVKLTFTFHCKWVLLDAYYRSLWLHQYIEYKTHAHHIQLPKNIILNELNWCNCKKEVDFYRNSLLSLFLYFGFCTD